MSVVEYKRYSVNNLGETVIFDGVVFDSKISAYKNLAGMYGLNELMDILDSTKSYIYSLRRDTEINFRGCIAPFTKRRAKINGITFRNRTEAYKVLAKKYMRDELTNLLGVDKSYIYQLQAKTGIEFKKISIDENIYIDVKRAYKKLAPEKTILELTKILDKSISDIYFLQKETEIDFYINSEEKGFKSIENSKRIIVDGIEYKNKLIAYKSIAEGCTIEELMEKLNMTRNNLNQMRILTFIDYINIPGSLTVNGIKYKSVKLAYIDIAENYTANELSKLLGVKKSYLTVLKSTTGVQHLKPKEEESSLVFYIDGINFRSKKYAFKCLAKNHTKDELKYLLKTSNEYISSLIRITGVIPKDYYNYTFFNRKYSTKTEAYSELAYFYNDKELMSILNIQRSQLNIMANKTKVSYIDTNKIICNGIEFSNRKEAYLKFAKDHTISELIDLLKTDRAYINSISFYTGVKYKRQGEISNPITINGVEYFSKLDAYIEIAEFNTLDELRDKLKISSEQGVRIYEIKTGIKFKRNEFLPGTETNVLGKIYISKVAAYSDIYNDYSESKLKELLNVDTTYLNYLEKTTNLKYKRENKSFRFNTIEYKDKTEAYIDIAAEYNILELINILNLSSSSISVLSTTTGVDYKDKGKRLNENIHKKIKLEFNGKQYYSLKDAYIDLAPIKTANELAKLFNLSKRTIKSYQKDTGVEYIDEKPNKSFKLEDGREYSSKKEAYIDLAEKHTIDELKNFLKLKTNSSIRSYETKTGVKFKRNTIFINDKEYLTKKEAYIDLHDKFMSDELCKLLDVNISSLTNMQTNTGLTYISSKENLVINGEEYSSKTEAYIDIAHKYDIEELVKLLNTNRNHIIWLSGNTKVKYKYQGQTVKKITIDEVEYLNNFEAYKAIAENYTCKELAELLNVSETTVRKYRQDSGVLFLK